MINTEELIYKDLCYKLTGFAYEVDNTIGFGFAEKVYSDAFEELLKNNHIVYRREVYYPLKIGDKTIAQSYFDFLIEDKIVVELKVGGYKFKSVFQQIFQYLKISKLKLGMIIRFTENGVLIKRIPNLY